MLSGRGPARTPQALSPCLAMGAPHLLQWPRRGSQVQIQAWGGSRNEIIGDPRSRLWATYCFVDLFCARALATRGFGGGPAHMGSLALIFGKLADLATTAAVCSRTPARPKVFPGIVGGCPVFVLARMLLELRTWVSARFANPTETCTDTIQFGLDPTNLGRFRPTMGHPGRRGDDDPGDIC